MKKLKKSLNQHREKIGRAVLRVSSEMQALTQHGSLEAQKQRIERWREVRSSMTETEYNISGWVQEEQSAFREKNLKRVQMLKLMQEMEQGKIDFIAFESVSRLFRAVDFATRFIRLAEEQGIEIWEIESGLNYNDRNNPYIYQMFIMKAASSETESVITSHRVTTKVREAMVVHGKDPTPRGSFLGLDLHPKRVGFYLVNKVELAIVVDIMKAFVQFKNYPETIDYCREKGYKTKTYLTKEKNDKEGNILSPEKRGGDYFVQSSLRSMFSNDRYCGAKKFYDKLNQFPKYQDENGFVTWNYGHGQIIDQALLDQVTDTLSIAGFQKRPRKLSTKSFSLLGGIIYDQKGQMFHCQSAKDHQYQYYFNPNNGLRLSMREFDQMFIKLLESYKNESSTVDSVLNAYIDKLQLEVAAYGKQVMEIALEVEKRNQQLDQLAISKRQKMIENANNQVILSFNEEIKKIEEEIKTLSDNKVEVNAKKEAALMSCNADFIKKNFSQTVEAIKSIKGNAKKLLIKSLVKRITVESETVAKVVFNSAFLTSSRSSKQGGEKVVGSEGWWDYSDLNTGPPGYEPGALTN